MHLVFKFQYFILLNHKSIIIFNQSYLGLAHSSYKTSLLHFSNNVSDATGWTKHPERFENIVKAIKNCSLRDSLKTVVVNTTIHCIGSTKAREILDRNGLTEDKVKVEEKWYEPDSS